MTSGDTRARWPLWTALAAGCAGSVILVAWFGTYWPGRHWTVLSRAPLIAKAHEVSRHFGLNTDDWKASTVTNVSKSLANDLQQHPSSAKARRISPLSLQITFVRKTDGETAVVGVDSAGVPIFWRAPDKYKQGQAFASEGEAAAEAFRFFAGAQAAAYSSSHSMGEDAFTENYIWTLRASPPAAFGERIKVVVKNSLVRSVERRAYLSSNHLSSSDDDDADSGHEAEYWGVFSAIFGLICTAGLVVILGVYVLWLARRAVNQKFPLRLAGGALVVMSAALVLGSAGEAIRSTGDAGPVFASLFIAGAILCSTAAGRGISAAARSKWLSLEQLCLLAPFAKSTGYSLAAGILFSPLLVAIPYLIAGCGWFPGSTVIAQSADLLYSRWPLLDSLNVGTDAYLLGLFGFGIPALRRTVRFPWLFWVIALPIGVLFFADQTRVVTGPLSAPVAAGICTVIISGFVYFYFDLLAVLTLQLANALLLGCLIRAGQGFSTWSFVAMTGGLLMFAFWCISRGRTVAEGDPLASIPALGDFRAEREKLLAEFSLARRAQQDMLPQNPPTIPGYSLAASCTPSLEVGGDLYDFLQLPDGRIGLGVADVSGKGVPAALYMTLTKGLLASITKNNAELVSVVQEVNRHLHGVTRKKVFVTMALGFLDAENRSLECVRAGHNPVVWRQASLDKTTLVSPAGLGLGITASRVFTTQLKVAEMALAEGDAVVFYSDGITEAMNSILEQFGEERLMASVQRADSLDAAAVRDAILADVRTFLGGVHPQDDMTLVVLRVGAARG